MLVPSNGVRVGTRPTRVPGAMHGHPMQGPVSAKPSRIWTPNLGGSGLWTPSQPRNPSDVIAKRSFRRACRRAAEHGWTKYRGRTLRAQQLSNEQLQLAQRMLQARRQPQTASTQACGADVEGRLRVTVWNSGGLAYQDLMQWLQTSSIVPDILILLETRLAMIWSI